VCADVDALGAIVALPADPKRREGVGRLESAVTEVVTLERAGRYADGLARLDRLLPEVRALDYSPLLARSLFALAGLQVKSDDTRAASRNLYGAMTAAARSGDARLSARIWIRLLYTTGVADGTRAAEALAWLPFATAALESARAGPALRAELIHVEASLLQSAERFDEAIAAHERALALRRALADRDDLAVARSLDALCQVLRQGGRFAEAEPHCERALRAFERELGPRHPEVGAVLFNTAGVLAARGLFDQARPLLTRGLAIFEGAYEPDHRYIASALNNISSVLERQGDPKSALPYARRVVEIRERTLAPEHPALASALMNLGNMERMTGDQAEARRHLERALAIQQAAPGRAGLDSAMSMIGLAEIALDESDLTRAESLLRAGLALRERLAGPNHPENVFGLVLLGRTLRLAGRAGEAVVLLERAIALPEVLPLLRGHARFELAQTTWASNRARARVVAGLAREDFIASGESAGEIDAWLESRRADR
jgi:serine/threonine-protein kinase